MRNFFLFSLRGTFTFIQFILLQPNSPERKGGEIPPLRNGLQVWGGYLATAQRPVSKGGPGRKLLGEETEPVWKLHFIQRKTRETQTESILSKVEQGFFPAQVIISLLTASNFFKPPGPKCPPPLCSPTARVPSPYPGLTHHRLGFRAPRSPPQAPTVLRRAGTFAVRD